MCFPCGYNVLIKQMDGFSQFLKQEIMEFKKKKKGFIAWWQMAEGFFRGTTHVNYNKSTFSLLLWTKG